MAPLVARTPARSAMPIMGYEDVALNCLEDGCSVDTVDELVRELKQVKNPSVEVMKMINDLQKLNESPSKNKNAIEKIVAAASRSFSVVEDFEFTGEPLGYTGQPGTTTTAGKALD